MFRRSKPGEPVERRIAGWFDAALADIRYAGRTIRRRPSFAVLATLTIAVGIGAAAATFSIVDIVLLRPLPFKEADRLVSLKVTMPGMRNEADPIMSRIWNELDPTYPQYEALRQREGVFDEIGTLSRGTVSLHGKSDPERVPSAHVSASLFPLLGIRPAGGRFFTAADEKPDAERTAVLSYELWVRAFGGDPGTIGRAILLDVGNGPSPHTVLGIVPPKLDFASHGVDGSPTPAIWTPIHGRPDPDDSFDFETLALLKRGVSMAAAEQAVEEAANAAPMWPGEPFGRAGGRVIQRQDFETRDARGSLLLLMSASGLLLVIAGANVANLLLGQAAVREQEIATRAALGAGRWRITRQLITESLVLSLAGGALGSLLAPLGVRALLALAPAELPRMAEIGVDSRILAAALAASIVAGVCFGLAPALTLFRASLNETLKQGSRRQSGAHGWMQGWVIAGEIALSFVLLAGAALLVQSLMRMNAVNLGFEPRNILTVRLRPTGPEYARPGALEPFFAQVLPQLKALPGVEDASIVDSVPFAQGSATNAEIEGRPLPPGEAKLIIQYRSILPNYFSVIRAKMATGRPFTEAESTGNAPVMIVNRTMAGLFWPGEDPLFKRVRFQDRWHTIVGVVGDIRELALSVNVPPTLYIPQNRTNPQLGIVLRTAAAPESLAPSVRSRIHEFDPNLPIDNIDTFESLIANTAAEERYRTILVSVFAGAAGILALIGLYGVISRIVVYRTRELGVRIALGARPADVVGMVLQKSLLFTLAGIAAGLPAALAASRILSSYLFEITATDPATYVAISLALIGAALFASFLPARRASRIDPIEALRVE